MHTVTDELVEKAILVGLQLGSSGGWAVEDSLNELRLLAESAGAVVLGSE
ncbi:MAG TPA: GTPase HflX, partial [Firmicutes bacterium]|nr:GTPase HflX [Bacillota bacterium]